MFSQRNNPYCELLQNCMANIDIKNEILKELTLFMFVFCKNHIIFATKH